MRRLLALLALLAVLGGAPFGRATADQTDPRLDALFAGLKAAPGLARAQRLEAQIWRIWLQHPDAEAYKATQLGVAHMNRGDADAAERAFSRAIKRQPDFAEAWNKRATLRFFTGDLDGSVADCAQVLRLEPRHFGALAGLGMIFSALEDWPSAIHWFETALAVNPLMPGVEAGLAAARRRQKGEET